MPDQYYAKMQMFLQVEPNHHLITCNRYQLLHPITFCDMWLPEAKWFWWAKTEGSVTECQSSLVAGYLFP
jgi:hypothetical protein